MRVKIGGHTCPPELLQEGKAYFLEKLTQETPDSEASGTAVGRVRHRTRNSGTEGLHTER
jgi:hypothetical protein